MVNTVAFVIIWVGKLPNTFDVWFQSLKQNTDFDFFLFTDQPRTDQYFAPNFNWNYLDLNQFNGLITTKLNQNFGVTNAYKIADFKPVYGKLFNSYLTQYTHWGYCDNDILLGKISNFIKPDLLINYDKLFYRGHFTIIKNTEKCNSVYLESTLINTKKALSINYNTFFDEWYGITQIFDENKLSQFFDDKLHFNVDHNSPFLKATNLKNYFFQVLEYKNGQLYHVFFDFSTLKITKNELLYAHIEKRKYLKNNKLNLNNGAVLLNSIGFNTIQENINLFTLALNKTANIGQVIFKINKKLKVFLGKEKQPIDLFLKENYEQNQVERHHYWRFN